MSEKMLFKIAQRKLTLLWLVVGGICLMVLIIPSVGGKFVFPSEDLTRNVWVWFTQYIFPILLLIISTHIVDFNRRSSTRKVDKFYFKLSFYSSLFYLIVIFLILLVIVSNKLSELANVGDLEQFLNNVDLFLTPTNGLITAVIGLFFYNKSS